MHQHHRLGFEEEERLLEEGFQGWQSGRTSDPKIHITMIVLGLSKTR